jgi:Mn-dependent DtxR family transcriptional regulator
MKLTKREAQVLDCLVQKKATLKEIAQALKMKPPNLTRLAKRLVRFGLISITRNGRNGEAGLDASTWFGLSTIRSNFPQLQISDIFAGYVPFLLSFIKEKESFSLKDLDLPPATAKRILARMRRLGLVSMPKKGVYRIRDEAEHVAGFCRNVFMMAHSADARGEIEFLDHGIYSFDSAKCFAAVFIAYREAPPKHYWPTAFSVAHEYGLQLLPSGRYYYASTKPDLGDVIIHTLAVQKNIRGIIYASYLALKNKYNIRLLLRKRQAFGLGKEYISGFAEFIESRGRKPFAGLTGFDELRSLGYGNV